MPNDFLNSPESNPFEEDNSKILSEIFIEDIDDEQYFDSNLQQQPAEDLVVIASPIVFKRVIPAKFTLWAIAITLIPSSIVAGFAYQTNYQSVRDAERHIQEVRASALAENFNNFALRQYEDTKKLAQGLASPLALPKNKKQLSDRQKQLITNRLTQYKNNSKIISNLGIYNLNGNLILAANSDSTNSINPKLEQSVLQKVLKFNSPTVNQSVWANKQYLMQFVVPIPNLKTQKPQSILISEIPINSIPTNFATGKYVIADLITDKDNKLFLSVYPENISPSINNEIAQNNFVVASTLSTQGLPDLNWKVGIISNSPEINYGYIIVLATCILILVLLIALITYLAAQKFSDRLIKTSQQISHQISQNSNDQKFELSTQEHDEIYQLEAHIKAITSKFHTSLTQKQTEINQLQIQQAKYQQAQDQLPLKMQLEIDSAKAKMQEQKAAEFKILQSEYLDRTNEIASKTISQMDQLKLEFTSASERSALQYQANLEELLEQQQLIQLELDQKNSQIEELEAQLDTKLKELTASHAEKCSETKNQLQALTQNFSNHNYDLIKTENTELMAKQILHLREAIAISAKKAKRLSESSQKIAKVIDLIQEIGTESNFLAVNAGIKANREHNKDFNIFSDQVGKIANMSVAAMEEMTQLATNIQSETREVMGNLELGTTQVAEATKLITEVQADLQTAEATLKTQITATESLYSSLQTISESLEF